MGESSGERERERERERRRSPTRRSLATAKEQIAATKQPASVRASERGRHNPPKIDFDQDKRPEIYDIFYCELDIV